MKKAMDLNSKFKSVTEIQFQEYANSIGMPHFDASETPLLLLGRPFFYMIFVMDPEVIRELYTTKSTKVDKNGDAHKLFEPYLGTSIIFSPASNPMYKPRRKHIGTAFYKEKLSALTSHLQILLTDRLNKWMKILDESEDGTFIIES